MQVTPGNILNGLATREGPFPWQGRDDAQPHLGSSLAVLFSSILSLLNVFEVVSLKALWTLWMHFKLVSELRTFTCVSCLHLDLMPRHRASLGDKVPGWLPPFSPRSAAVFVLGSRLQAAPPQYELHATIRAQVFLARSKDLNAHSSPSSRVCETPTDGVGHSPQQSLVSILISNFFVFNV